MGLKGERTLSPKVAVREQLRSWSVAHGVAIDAEDHTRVLEGNLLVPMSEVTLSEFGRGSGELGTPGRRGRIQALHSSAALACNVFDYWRDRDTSVLASALGLTAAIVGIEFERALPTGLPGVSPSLDVVLTLADGSIVAIESKFLEPYGGRHAAGFRPKYLEPVPGLWEHLGYDNCQRLAMQLSVGEVTFRRLNAEQLLKQVLGLAVTRSSWGLIYLWYAVPGPPGSEHEREAREFARVVAADGIAFRSLSYQSLYGELRARGGESDGAYLEYLGTRYFDPVIVSGPDTDA